jgi:hypothetical protein
MGPSDLRCSRDYQNELALTLSLHVTTSYRATLLQMDLSSKLLLFHSTLLQTKLISPAFIPLEIWSRVIQLCNTPGDGSWEDSHWPMPKMITALSLTCSRLYHECKRQMLACIWVEFGPSNMHRHTIPRGPSATYSVESLLAGDFLQKESDRDLVRRICLCIQVGNGCGKYPSGGRGIVKKVLDHLLAYLRGSTHRSFDDVLVTFVGEGIGVDWTILAGLTLELDGTLGVRIAWRLARVLIHDGDRLYLHRIDDDDSSHAIVDRLVSVPVQSLHLTPVLDKSDIPAVLIALKGSLRSLAITFTSQTKAATDVFNQTVTSALSSLTELLLTIVDQEDNTPSWLPRAGLQWQSPGGPLVWHLQGLVQLLQTMPSSHSLRFLSIIIKADLGYNGRMDKFCQEFETVSASLVDQLSQPMFSSLKIDIDILLRPTNWAAAGTNLTDSRDAWGRCGWDKHGWAVQFDKNGIRIPDCAFRKEREKVESSFGVMRAALEGHGNRVTWTMESTEMSANCKLRAKARAQDNSETKTTVDLSQGSAGQDKSWGEGDWTGFAW